ncbi:carbohydrate porin [Synechocystis sp. PCC 7339]|uniref:iron uptake porin n=1 Tax=Synechocystis sp. PCC 7339 TaxID=2782213 RepID=UPI001CBF70A4|nr:iron uptake porin [Synechocystis sp. PCC 7339]UAJ73166.1 carbohydrate porin [Synechocystis sp. PCC 7339]
MTQDRITWLAGLAAVAGLTTFPGSAGAQMLYEDADSMAITPVQELTPLMDEPMGQVTSVSELRDVQPADWAYEALKSLVERYGCIVGYPDRTFRGDAEGTLRARALSRWEFAAGLNACMNTMERLIQENVAVIRADIDKLQRLAQEFRAELSALGARVDNLETRTAYLEDHQFSTTTKLNGEVIFSISGATGGEPDADSAQIVFNDRVRLNLTTSFTGKDALITGLQAYNFTAGNPITGTGSVAETLFPNDASILGEGMTSFNYEPQFAGFNPQNLQPSCDNNSVCLYKLLYITPVTDNFTVFVGPKAEVTDAFPTIVPFASEGQGTLSRAFAINPVLRVSGGTTETGLASAAGFIYKPNDVVDWRALYGSVNAAIPQNEGFPGTPLGAGLFNGSFVAATQLTLYPTENLDLGLNYAYSYHQINILGTGLTGAAAGTLGGLPLTTPVNVNSVGATLTWRINPSIYFTTYGAYFMVDQANSGSAFTNLASWMAGLYFPDAFAEGNTAGLMFGQPLTRVGAGNGATLTPDNISNRAIPYQIEAFYNYKINNNLSITPGAFVIFNPEGDSSNSTTGVFALRTTFTF